MPVGNQLDGPQEHDQPDRAKGKPSLPAAPLTRDRVRSAFPISGALTSPPLHRSVVGPVAANPWTPSRAVRCEPLTRHCAQPGPGQPARNVIKGRERAAVDDSTSYRVGRSPSTSRGYNGRAVDPRSAQAAFRWQLRSSGAP